MNEVAGGRRSRSGGWRKPPGGTHRRSASRPRAYIQRNIPNFEILNEGSPPDHRAWNAETVLEEIGVNFVENPCRAWPAGVMQVRGCARANASTSPGALPAS